MCRRMHTTNVLGWCCFSSFFSLSLSPLNIYSHTERYTYTYEYIETRATRCNYAEPWEGFTVLLPSLTSPPTVSLSLCSLVRFRQLFYSQVHPWDRFRLDATKLFKKNKNLNFLFFFLSLSIFFFFFFLGSSEFHRPRRDFGPRVTFG